MGCIVNGPGEMADADFGYVGGAPGKIDLYVGKEVVRRAIPMSGATDELIELIKVCPANTVCLVLGPAQKSDLKHMAWTGRLVC